MNKLCGELFRQIYFQQILDIFPFHRVRARYGYFRYLKTWATNSFFANISFSIFQEINFRKLIRRKSNDKLIFKTGDSYYICQSGQLANVVFQRSIRSFCKSQVIRANNCRMTATSLRVKKVKLHFKCQFHTINLQSYSMQNYKITQLQPTIYDLSLVNFLTLSITIASIYALLYLWCLLVCKIKWINQVNFNNLRYGDV